MTNKIVHCTIHKDGCQWGVFESEDSTIKHVAPIDEFGFLSPKHILDSACSCNPIIDTTDAAVTLIMHNEVPIQ